MPFYKMINTNIFVTVIAQIFRSVVSQWADSSFFAYRPTLVRLIIKYRKKASTMRKLWQTTWQCAAVFLCIVGGRNHRSFTGSQQPSRSWLVVIT